MIVLIAGISCFAPKSTLMPKKLELIEVDLRWERSIRKHAALGDFQLICNFDSFSKIELGEKSWRVNYAIFK